jgi:AcrR family transcriptional regulator
MDRLLARFGYQKTTVDDLAAEAGIGKGTVYLYFASKEQVALSCIDRLHERLLVKMANLAKGGKPAQDRITEILLERVMSRFEYCRNAASLDEMLAALQKELVIRKEKYHAEEALLLEGLLSAAAASGELPSCDYRAAAEAMILATNALLPYSLKTTQLGSSQSIEEKVRRVASLLISGLSGLPVAPREGI